MKPHEELKAELTAVHLELVKVGKNERTLASNEVASLCRELGFATRMLKDALAKG